MSLNPIERKRKEKKRGTWGKTKLCYSIESKIPKPGHVYINFEIHPECVVQWGMLFVTRKNQKSLDVF